MQACHSSERRQGESTRQTVLQCWKSVCTHIRSHTVHYGRSLTESDGNSSVSRHQQITLGATLIFHLVDGLLSTTAAHEVRRAGVLTWNALPDHIRTVADPVKFRELLKSHHFSQAFNICWFLCFSRCFSIWLTFVMQLCVVYRFS